MDMHREPERARQALERCRQAAARAGAALERARDDLSRIRVATAARIVRAEAAGTATGIALQRAGGGPAACTPGRPVGGDAA